MYMILAEVSQATTWQDVVIQVVSGIVILGFVYIIFG